MSAGLAQGSGRLAAIPAGRVPNTDGSEIIDLQGFSVQHLQPSDFEFGVAPVNQRTAAPDRDNDTMHPRQWVEETYST